MIIMGKGATREDVAKVVELIQGYECETHISEGEERTVIGVIGDERGIDFNAFLGMPGVEDARPVLKKYKLASREFHPEDSVINARGVLVGGLNLIVMGGPCAVENEDQTLRTAYAVAKTGADIIRGGAYKPRTSPYDFQGLGPDGLEILLKAKKETGLPVITEVMDASDIDEISEVADILQLGTRNAENYRLLGALGKAKKPVLLKRGKSQTIEGWLLSAEYVLSGGNQDVILCERGITTFETYTRNTLDVNAVAAAKIESHLPVIVDPSHGTGRRELVYPASKAGVAAGADGLLIEVQHDLDQPYCDVHQSVDPEELGRIIEVCEEIRKLNGRYD
jgi:3-deoxy-7-phosphoheptulonate synthase